MCKGNVKSRIKTKNEVSNVNAPGTKSNAPGFAFDASFEALYCSVEVGEFTNFLTGKDHFIEQFKDIRSFISKVSNKNFLDDLIHNGGMRHCYILQNDSEISLIKNCIKEAIKTIKADGYDADLFIEQNLGDERLYQIGYEGGIRYIGTYNAIRNVFRVYLIDHYHLINKNERKTKFSRKHLKYCVMNS